MNKKAVVLPPNFINLVETTKESLIGWGNPNSQILIIGCEPATPIDELNKINREILYNRDQWTVNLKDGSNFMSWTEQMNPSDNPCKMLEFGYDNYNPRHPYCRQINSHFPSKEGTSWTWWCYQKLIDKLRGITTRHRDLNFFDYAFVTDLSDINSPKSVNVKYEDKDKAIKRRKDTLFSHPFFQSFPITIVACGHYVRQFDLRLNDIFSIPYNSIQYDKNDVWINLHLNSRNRILLHTQHFAAHGLKINDYMDRIVNLCSDSRIIQ